MLVIVVVVVLHPSRPHSYYTNCFRNPSRSHSYYVHKFSCSIACNTACNTASLQHCFLATLLPAWSRSPLNENAVNAVNAAFVRCRGFAPAPLAAYYWDGVPLMKKLSRACLVEQLRHTFTTDRADLGPNSPFGFARSHCSQYRWPGAAVFGALLPCNTASLQHCFLATLLATGVATVVQQGLQ